MVRKLSASHQLKMAASSSAAVFEEGELALYWQPGEDVHLVHVDKVVTPHSSGAHAEYLVSSLNTAMRKEVAGCWLQKPEVTDLGMGGQLYD